MRNQPIREIDTVLHQGNLGGSKGHNQVIGIVLKIKVEIVEISNCCALDEDPFAHRRLLPSGFGRPLDQQFLEPIDKFPDFLPSRTNSNLPLWREAGGILNCLDQKPLNQGHK